MNNLFINQQKQINFVKKYFSSLIEKELSLTKVEGPFLSRCGDGIQDELSGHEQSAKINIKAMPNDMFEIIHSLAKWKRKILGKFHFNPGKGIYVNMIGLRPDENSLTAIHSVYVDQWDWEKVILDKQRTIKYLKYTVNKIYNAIKKLEQAVHIKYGLKSILPQEITFLHSEELLQLYPNLNSKEREKKITKKLGAIFLIGIGGKLSNGLTHDTRAPDYDDWTSLNEEGYFGLNGDIIVWNPILQCAFEISSMGIRVNPKTLIHQLVITKNKQKLSYRWHKNLIQNNMPQTIGGGIGQSRLIMLILQKQHIGEVQSSIWPIQLYKKYNNLL